MLPSLQPGRVPGPGGADSSLPARALSVSELADLLATLGRQVDERSDQLGVLEALLAQDSANRRFLPTLAPVIDGWFSSNFGYRIDPFTVLQTFHEGIDFPAEPGTSVIAAASGKVIEAGYHPQYGKIITIDHGNGLVSRYAHASRLAVSEGDLVVRGQRVAAVGSTGRSTGAHLHFEVRSRSSAATARWSTRRSTSWSWGWESHCTTTMGSSRRSACSPTPTDSGCRGGASRCRPRGSPRPSSGWRRSRPVPGSPCRSTPPPTPSAIRIMPINRKYPIARLLEAARRFARETGEPFTFEYVLLDGVNDTDADVTRLAKLLRANPVKLNLIPFNPVPGWLPYRPPARERVLAIRDRLLAQDLRVSVRWSRGAEARAACGQLALLPDRPASAQPSGGLSP